MGTAIKMLKPRNALRKSTSVEERALMRFMSRISVVSNPLVTPDKPSITKRDRSASTSSEEEAQLLMNLVLMSPKTPKSPPPDNSYQSPRSNSPMDKDDVNDEFHFCCPGLSLYPDRDMRQNGDRSNMVEIVPSSPSPFISQHAALPLTPKNNNSFHLNGPKITPQDVMSQEVETSRKSDVTNAANTVMRNIGSTFEYAIGSRIRVWTESLAKVVRMKAQTMQMQIQNNIDNDESTDAEAVRTQQECDDRERRVLSALCNVSQSISVDVVRTYFRVLPLDDTTKEREPPKKKSRYDGTSNKYDIPDDYITSTDSTTAAGEYSHFLERPLVFETRIDLSTTPGGPQMFVTLETPGIVTGLFKDNHVTGDVTQQNNNGDVTMTSQENVESVLKAVKIDLDIESLLFSIQRQSRFVVRKAAEDEIISLMNQRHDLTPKEERKEAFLSGGENTVNTSSRIPPRRLAPRTNNSNSNNTDSPMVDNTMPPPPPRVREETMSPDSSGFVSPSPGSPTIIHNHNTSNATAATTPNNSSLETSASQSVLVSPSPYLQSTHPTSPPGSDANQDINDVNKRQLPQLAQATCASFKDDSARQLKVL